MRISLLFTPPQTRRPWSWWAHDISLVPRPRPHLRGGVCIPMSCSLVPSLVPRSVRKIPYGPGNEAISFPGRMGNPLFWLASSLGSLLNSLGTRLCFGRAALWCYSLVPRPRPAFRRFQCLEYFHCCQNSHHCCEYTCYLWLSVQSEISSRMISLMSKSPTLAMFWDLIFP